MTMTAAEFTAARERLGWTHEQVAGEYGLTPAVVSAWERGSVKIPRDIAANLRWLAAVEERRAVLEASGLPECPEARALEKTLVGKEGQALVAAYEPVIAHAESCQVCHAREEYVERHGPAIPELPTPLWARAIVGFDALIDRLPAPLRPADGPAGEWRRTALGTAAVLSVLVAGMLGLVSVSRLATHGWESDWWRAVVTLLPVVILSYFIGFYLAGAAFDATRVVRHRFVGYVARGALAMAAFYGTIGLIMPLIDSDTGFADVPLFAGGLGALGAVIGGVLWVRDRLTGKLPKPTA